MVFGRLKDLAQRLRTDKAPPASPWRGQKTMDRGLLGEADLALDGKGQGLALWENDGKLWTMPIGPHSAPAMMRLPLGEGSQPRIVMNAAGRGMALWQCDAGGERQILGKLLGGSEEHGRVVFRTQGRIHHLQMAVDRRGNALVVWLLEKDGGIEVMTQSFDFRDLAWEQAPTTLGSPSVRSVEPRIAGNHREHAMVLWEDEGTSAGLVASHYWPTDRIWSDRPMPVVKQPTHDHRVVMDDQGNALALWIESPHGQRSTLQASFYDGLRSDWGEPEVLSQAQTFSSPHLVMSGDGEALAAWCQAEGHGASRLITKAFRKGQWEGGVDCLELGHGSVRDFAIDLGPEGEAGLLAVHQGPEGDWVSARLRKRDWSPSFPLVQASQKPCSCPRLRLCPQGASALWIQGAGKEKALLLVETW